MPGTIVIHTNNVTRVMTLADLRGFLRSCEAEDLPEDAVVRVKGVRDVNATWRHLGRRLIEVSARTGERLADELNEGAQLRKALGLPMNATSREVLDALYTKVKAVGQQVEQKLADSGEPWQAHINPEGVAVRAILGLRDDVPQDTVLDMLAGLLDIQQRRSEQIAEAAKSRPVKKPDLGDVRPS